MLAHCLHSFLTRASWGNRVKDGGGEQPHAHRERHPSPAPGGVSLEVRCTYCSQPLMTYPLIMNEDAERTVSHAACAVELANLLVDLFPFLSPPPPCERLFVLTATRCSSFPGDSCEERVTGVRNAQEPRLERRSRCHQPTSPKEARRSGITPSSARHRSVVPPGLWSRSSRGEGTAASAAPWLRSLFPRGAGQH